MKRGGKSGGGGLNDDLHALFSSLAGDDDDDDNDDGPGPSGGAASVSALFSTPSTGKQYMGYTETMLSFIRDCTPVQDQRQRL